jgi:hypothetical protein
MPTWLNVPEWGEVQALTVREVAKRLGVSTNNVEWYAEYDLLQSYMTSDEDGGCIKAQALYIDLEDVAHAERFAKQFPPDAPWQRILWARYEVRVWREKQQGAAEDPRATERTMIQPQRRPQEPQPPAPQKPKQIPRELRNTEFFDELDERQPSKPRQAAPLRQTVPPAGRQQQRRDIIEEDDYYAEPDAETEHDTGGRKQQPPRKRGLRLW